MKCSLCPRRCNADRTKNENLNGFCKMPLLPRVAKADLHFWEEPCISGSKGSGTIFFSGCSLSCVYCQNYSISHEGNGKLISVERLAEIFKELEDRGANNINLVNPTHFVLAIKKALDIYKPSVPIVYNSGGYDRVETLKSLEGYIDIYLMDLKYLSSARAKLYSGAEDYPLFATNAIKECVRQQPNAMIAENGMMQKGVIIRHLILPQGTNEAIKVFDWVHSNAKNSYFSMMSQYIPCGRADEYPIINRKITKREYDKVLNHMMDSGFLNCYIQERSSSAEDYIPIFDNKGV